MADLVEKRRSRYGKDQVCVQTADGLDIGHVDLQARRIVTTHTTPSTVSVPNGCSCHLPGLS